MRENIILQERYKIVKELGKSAFTVKYLAVDLRTKENCVLKELKVDAAEFWENEINFRKQANILSHLKHENIPGFVDYFTDDTGDVLRVVLVQEYREGKSLSRWIREGRHFTEKEVAGHTQQIVKILLYLHEFSPPVLHRNIKPDNILIGAAGDVFLSDFGMLKDKLTAEEKPSSNDPYFSHTPLEEFRGTPVPASDIYSLGTSMIFALSQKDPLEIGAVGDITQFREHVNISDDFHDILLKMVRPEPEKRYPSANELKHDLDCLLMQHMSERFNESRKVHNHISRKKRKIVPVILIFLGVLLCAGIVGVYFFEDNNEVISDHPAGDYEGVPNPSESPQPHVPAIHPETAWGSEVQTTGETESETAWGSEVQTTGETESETTWGSEAETTGETEAETTWGSEAETTGETESENTWESEAETAGEAESESTRESASDNASETPSVKDASRSLLDKMSRTRAPDVPEPDGEPSEQAGELFSSSMDLVIYYPLDGDGRDFSGLENHAKVYRGEPVSDRFGYKGQAYRLDGTKSYIRSLNRSKTDFTRGLTFTAWIRPHKSRKGYILGKWGSKGKSREAKYLLFDSGQNISFRVFPGMRQPLKSDAFIRLDQWTHIAATFDGAEAKLFVNGKLSARAEAEQTLWASAGNWYVGSNGRSNRAGGQVNFAGAVDDVRVYNRAFTTSDVENLYLEEKSESTSIEVHLKSGRVLFLERYWEEEGRIKYEQFGAVVGIKRDKIKKIVKK